jgi:hypothetical protein
LGELKVAVAVTSLQGCASSGEQLENQSYKRKHQQQMYESAEGIAAHNSD